MNQLYLLDRILVSFDEQNLVKFCSIHGTTVANGIPLKTYLKKHYFTQFIKELYTEEELRKVWGIISRYEMSDEKFQIKQASLIAANWWRAFFASPSLESTSLLKSYFLIFTGKRYTEEIINSIEVMDKFEAELRSMIQTDLLFDKKVIISLNNRNDILKKCLQKAGYAGMKKGDIQMSITKEDVTVRIDKTSENLYCYYNSKKKYKK